MIFKKKNTNTSNKNNNLYSILIIADKLNFGDTTKNIIDLSNYLTANNVNVFLIVRDAKQQKLLDHKVNIIFNKHFIGNIFFTRKYIQNLCKKNKIDVVLLYSLLNLSSITKSIKKLKIPIILYINNLFKISTRYHYNKYKAIERVDRIIVPTAYIAEFLIQHYKIDLSKINIVLNGVDNTIYNNKNILGGRIANIIPAIGEDCLNKKIFLYPSKFVDYKGHLLLIEAISQIKDKENKNFICIFMGDFQNSIELRQTLLLKIQQLKLEPYIRIIDQLDDLSPIYSLSYAVMCVSQNDEGYSRIIEEAYLCERPVIATNIGVFPKYVINTKTGYIVRKNSSVDISKAIDDLLSLAPSKYLIMCKNAKNYVDKYFSISSAMNNIQNIITNTISGYCPNNK